MNSENTVVISNVKVGTFDWIIDYEEISHFLDTFYTNIKVPNELQKVLVVGCGTSTLSISLKNRSNYGEIVSIDNDIDCIEHMKKLYPLNGLHWLYYDLIESDWRNEKSILSICSYFDLIIDKGTFDAIIVEGTASKMLMEIHRVLRIEGVYILCSIHSTELIKSLLSIEDLQFSVSVFSIMSKDENNSATIAVCIKQSNEDINFNILESKENIIMNHYYQIQNPLLNETYKNDILNYYKIHGRKPIDIIETDSEGRLGEYTLDLKSAYKALFQSNSSLEYTLELFMEDLMNFNRADPDRITFNEAIQFITSMQ
eukprot:gene6522-8963_t